jgi:hypothetical protein
MKTIPTIAVAGLVGLATLQSAHAGGFLAETFIKPIFGVHAAREADTRRSKTGSAMSQSNTPRATRR